MPSLRNILHKRDELSSEKQPQEPQQIPTSPPTPEIIFMRTTTNTQEIITPPTHADELPPLSPISPESRPSLSTPRRSFSFLHRSPRSGSISSPSPSRTRERRLSSLLHLDGRQRSESRNSSANIPADLPQVLDEQGDKEAREEAWERRATVLVQQNPQFGQLSPRASEGDLGSEKGRPRSPSQGNVGAQDDINIQEAIRLHEAGDLERSTQMFGQLADPNGANNPLSQVLYGLALRHGWGCAKDETQAVSYLSAAASNSAAVESEALRAGMKKGGVAKGELVLAMFELANCFRNGWGVKKDPFAARQYYETAANLGDTDAMDQVAWCYLEGFGGKKDKFKAAKYLRLAEANNGPTVGNSWIWKEKYNPK
ncbi:uncharacterized protein N7477_005015 [Penicillium maclennaniae]|uniref:uncharacterized protein n=1 Tax=Penicillium maclennaniae TaxID=1343394 RepID=UPI0025415246|nr:uncharacterized protein N7477_005015 [Penicillium maclennaniae]KAJ5675081.1 hypothetical protein N7477_005015 [Penicillium maclennaniae]